MNATHQAVLVTLLDFAQNDRHATVLRLADALELPRATIDHALLQLDRAGLVDAARVRLSLFGLAMAAAMPARRARRSASAKKAA